MSPIDLSIDHALGEYQERALLAEARVKALDEAMQVETGRFNDLGDRPSSPPASLMRLELRFAEILSGGWKPPEKVG